MEKSPGNFPGTFSPTSRACEYVRVLRSSGTQPIMKKIHSTLLLASALCSLLAPASSSNQSRLAATNHTFQFQLADDPPLPPPPPPPGSGDAGEKYA
jgi:hypothetical protein